MNANKRRLTILIAVLVVLCLAVGAWYGLQGRQPALAAVELRENGQVVRMVDAKQGVDAVSQRVGFEVKVPPEPPLPGLKLEGIDSDLGPEGLANALKRAILVYSNGATGRARMLVRIEQTGVRFGAPTDRAERLADPAPNTELYQQILPQVTAYGLLTPERGFVVTVQAESFNEQSILAMIRSLAK